VSVFVLVGPIEIRSQGHARWKTFEGDGSKLAAAQIVHKDREEISNVDRESKLGKKVSKTVTLRMTFLLKG
jgi:nucleoside diphosphate kinase